MRFSDHSDTYSIDGEPYTNIGQLLSISATASEIRATESEVTVVVSGVPTGSIAEILNNNPKGAELQIKRVFFNPVTGLPLGISGNPATKFLGLVTNYSIDEEYDPVGRQASNSIALICSSELSILKNKVTGRRTNPYDQTRFFPGDLAMNRVPTIQNSSFQFGAPVGSNLPGGA